MAKHLYSPRISDVWKEVEATLDSDEALTPHLKNVIAGAIARLEERDQQLEDALLGDLTVNNVDGTVGTVSPVKARQIGWSANFGYYPGNATDSGRGDNTQDAVVAYGEPFVTDTTVLLITPILVPAATAFLPFLRVSDRTGFTVTISSSTPATPTPIPLCYVAVGF